jgi:hypothetical protein
MAEPFYGSRRSRERAPKEILVLPVSTDDLEIRDMSASRPGTEEKGRHMALSPSLKAEEIARAVAETRRECADLLRRSRSDVAEIRAVTQKAIAASRELMVEADATIARR